MVSLWLQAMTERPFVLFGRRLLPFSLAHIFYLRRMNSPYTCGGETSFEDLCFAVKICSMTRKEIAAFMGGGALTWWARIRLMLWSARWSRYYKAGDAALRQHIADYSNVADRWQWDDDPAPVECKCPWELHMVRMMCEKFNMTPEEAWNTPFSLARCYSDSVIEAAGNGKTMISEYEMMAMEHT